MKRWMKSFLGILMLMITVSAIVITMVYHTSVNAELRFEPRESHEEYINTRRSYRPRRLQNTPPPPVKEMKLQDDDMAEEVES